MTDYRVRKRFRYPTGDHSEVTSKNLRKIRVICSDPEATESSSDELDDVDRSSSRRIVYEILIGVNESEAVEPKKDVKKFAGVWLRKCGKWASRIRDPFRKKRIWLGTFNTPEEASQVYIAKKQQFEARLTLTRRTHQPNREEEEEEEEVEEASIALQAMKTDFSGSYFNKSPKTETSTTTNFNTNNSNSTSNSNSVEDSREEGNKPPWFGLGIDMLEIDNNGNLLGQFRRLDDDLWIC